MNVLYVCPRYYPSIGGVEYTVQRLAEGMKNRGNNVSVVCGSSSKGVEILKNEGVNVLRVPTYAPSNAYYVPKNRKIVEEFIGNDVDIVHTHSAHAVISMFPLGLKKSLKPRWKIVFSLHFSTPGYTLFRNVLWRLIWKRQINSGLKYVDAIHSTSMLESQSVLNQFSNAEGKVALIPLGLDEDVFCSHWKGVESDYVLYCGRIEKYKQIDLAVKYIEHVRKRGYPIKFFIVGDGSRSGFFKKIAENKDWIIYMPHRQRSEYLELLSSARAVINLSLAENFNLFLAEACAVGVPIVATPEAAAFCPRFANVKCSNSDAIADVIVKALSSPKACIFPRICVPHNWKDAIGEFEEFYINVLES
jgi:glycosyltransferase involved in cell wall biosynthesis